MATVAEIRDAAIAKTRRFDQVTETQGEVLRAIRYLHGLEKFDRDLKSENKAVEYKDSSNEFEFDSPVDLKVPHLFIPKFDTITAGSTVRDLPKSLTLISAEDVYKIRREGKAAYNNTVFRHGSLFVGYTNSRPVSVDISYWSKPVITGEDFEDWISTDWEDAVLFLTLVQVYGDNGHKEKANENKQKAGQEIQNLRATERFTGA